MKYVIPIFSFIKSHALICGLFLVLEIIEIPYEAIMSINLIVGIVSSIASLCLAIFTLYVSSGFLSIIWNKFYGNTIELSDIFTESKKYFPDYFSVAFITGLIYIVCWLIIRYSIGKLCFSDIELHLFDKTNTAIIISQILGATFLLFFVLSCSLVYVKKYSGLKAIKHSIYYSKVLMANSRVILFLVLTAMFVNIVLNMLYYNFNENWIVEVLWNSVWPISEIFIFLVLCQIIYNKPLLNQKA